MKVLKRYNQIWDNNLMWWGTTLQDVLQVPSRLLLYGVLFPMGFPGGTVSIESTCNVGDLGSIPGLGRSPGEGKGYPLQYSGQENSVDCMVHGIAKSRTWLSNFHSLGTDCDNLMKGRIKKKWEGHSTWWVLLSTEAWSPQNNGCTSLKCKIF